MRRALLLVALLVGLSLAAPAKARDPTPETDTWIEADWTITGRRLDAFDVTGTIGVHEAEIEGEVRTADGIRDRHRQAEQNGQGDQFKDGIEDAVRDEVDAALARFFPAGEHQIHEVRVEDDSLAFGTDQDPYHPTVDVRFDASVETSLPGDDLGDDARQRVVDALTMGASTTIPLEIEADVGANHTVALELPPEVRAIGDVASPVRATVDNWNGSTVTTSSVSIDVTGSDATRFSTADGTVTVRIDLHDVALDLLGGSATVRTDLRASSEIRSVELPDRLRDLVPPDVHLDAVGADGIRLAIERGYLPANWTDQARDRFAERATRAIRSAFGDDATVAVDLDETTVNGGVQGPPDADPPLIVEAHAEGQREIALFGAGSSPAALTLTTLDQTFAVDAFPPFDARYEIVLPEGLTLESAKAPGSDEVQETTIDGRDALVITVGPDQQDATAAMSIGVTPWMLLGASPLLLLVLVASSALVVLVVVRAVVGRREDGGRERGST